MTSDHIAEFSAFYESSKDECLRAAAVSMANAEAPDDLVAEAFSRAWDQWPSVRVHPAPRAWVLRTALNLHRDEWRRRSRPLRLVTEQPTEADWLPLDPRIPEAVEQLSERQRQVLVYRVLLGLSTAETAAEIGIDASTVPVHLRRALSALRTSPLIQGVSR